MPNTPIDEKTMAIPEDLYWDQQWMISEYHDQLDQACRHLNTVLDMISYQIIGEADVFLSMKEGGERLAEKQVELLESLTPADCP